MVPVLAPLTVALVIAVALLPGLIGAPRTESRTAWYLNNDELGRVAAAARSDATLVGHTIVADAIIVGSGGTCDPGCHERFVLAGLSSAEVDGLPDLACASATSCPSGTVLGPAPMAFTIGNGVLTWISAATLNEPDPSVPSTLDDYQRAVGGDVVEGWLSTSRLLPSCASDGGPYGCGDAAWLTSAAYPDPAAEGAFSPPSDGVRVQNGAYAMFSGSPTAIGPARHALFLMGPPPSPGPTGAACFQCSQSLGRILARIDPIQVPGVAPVSSPAPSPETAWYLTTAQLARVVAGTATSNENVGKTVIANVQITDLFAACPNEAPRCPYTTIIAGSEPHIPVTNAELPTSCPAPGPAGQTASCGTVLPPPGPTALTIEPGSVSFVASVQIGINDPRPSTVEQFIEASPTNTILVDGWLSTMGIPPACPAPLGGIANGPFGCGQAAWLTDQPFTATVPAGTDGWNTTGPARGLRVQNDAYETFAPNRAVTDSAGFAASERGLYLIASADPMPSECFMCATVRGTLLARIDPVSVPVAIASPIAPPSLHPTPTAVPSWLVDESGLGELVAAAEAGVTATPFVVASVGLEPTPGCEPSPSMVPGCGVVVAGSDPLIPVLGIPRPECPIGSLCPPRAYPTIPDGHTFAFQINDDGAVEWLGAVAADGSTWTFGAFRQLLGGVQASDPEAKELYVVDGWVARSDAILDCAVPPSDPTFSCPGTSASWLLPDAPTDGPLTKAPAGSIRLPNDLPTAEATPTHVVALLRPAFPSAQDCSECDSGLAATVVASLDPEAAGTRPTPSPTDPTSATASQLARAFETARATGDFETAWSYLGPATRALFGNEQTFAAQEAAYNATGAAVFKIAAPSRDADLLDPSNIGNAASDYVASTAWYVGVNHPNVEGSSAGFEGLVVAQGIDGSWHVWIVH